MASTQVRLHPTTKAFLDIQQHKINKAREKCVYIPYIWSSSSKIR